MPSKVLVISATWPPHPSGGAEYAMQYAARLAAAGCDVRVITERSAASEAGPGIAVRPIMKTWGWLEYLRLCSEIKSFKPDGVVLHFMGRAYNHHPMITLLPAMLKKRFKPSPRFVTLFEYAGPADHTTWSKSQRWLHRIAARRLGWKDLDFGFGALLRDGDGLILLAESHRQLLIKHLPACESRAALCPPPSLIANSTRPTAEARRIGREKLGVSANSPLFGFFGFIYPYKGLETLIDAAGILKQRHQTDWQFALVGGTGEAYLKSLGREGYTDELRQRARERGVEDRLHWSGWLDPQTDLASCCLAALDLCVLPFDHGVHLNNSSFAAAASHGLPIITTQGPNSEAAFQHGVNAHLVTPQSAETLADAIAALLASPEQRANLSQGALAMCEEWFSWDRLVDQTLKHLGLSRAENHPAP